MGRKRERERALIKDAPQKCEEATVQKKTGMNFSFARKVDGGSKLPPEHRRLLSRIFVILLAVVGSRTHTKKIT